MNFPLFKRLKIKNYQFRIPQQGFTLIELMVVMGIFAILMGISTLSLSNIERSSSLKAEVNKMIPDLKEQQVKAMSGDSEGTGAVNDYGVHFETNSYILFRGTYTAGSADNFEVELGPNIQVSTAFPNAEVIFTRGSGEISSGGNTITLTDTTNGNDRTITINALGVVTGVN